MLAPTGPNNEGFPSSAPANGPSPEHVFGTTTIIDNNHVHANPYPNVGGPGQPKVCEAGNETYIPGKVEIGSYSKMPRMFFGSGTAASLGPSAALLILALCEHANRNNSNTFKASDRALASDTGCAPRTICDSRKKITIGK